MLLEQGAAPPQQGTNSMRAKVSNQSAILKTIYHCGPITRAEIAQRLDLTLPTITTTVNSMMEAGIVREISGIQPDRQFLGRKAHPVDIVPESRHFIGLEVQGHRRVVCLLNYRGQTLFTLEDQRVYLDYNKNMELSRDMIRQALAASGMGLDQIDGIGVCAPGLVDAQRGVLETWPGFQWKNRDIRGDFVALTGYQGTVSVENNACVRTFGIQLFQSGLLETAQTFAYLYIDYGIACPLVLNTAGVFGSVVGAGEAGHMVMVPNGQQCICGNCGCLEAYSSDRAILSRCGEFLLEGRAPLLRQLCGESPPDMDDVLHAQEMGDADVAEIVKAALYILGLAVANINNFACPDKMLIECQLFRRQENREQLLTVVQENLCGMSRTDTEFIFMEPDPLSGARGAAAMAICKNLETYIKL